MLPCTLLADLRKSKPLVCHVTNYVTAGDCALAVASLGGSPIMIESRDEAEEMVSKSSALVLNIGTVSRKTAKVMVDAGKTANKLRIPVVLDPAGAGATEYRTEVFKTLVSEIKADVIKGNAGEIAHLAGMGGKVKGTESLTAPMSEAAEKLALATGTIVGMSGSTDYISNGRITLAVENSVPMMGAIPGTGCMLSSAVGCFLGVRDVSLETVSEAFQVFSVAAKITFNGSFCGMSDFKSRFFDTLGRITDMDVKNKCRIAKL